MTRGPQADCPVRGPRRAAFEPRREQAGAPAGGFPRSPARHRRKAPGGLRPPRPAAVRAAASGCPGFRAPGPADSETGGAGPEGRARLPRTGTAREGCELAERRTGGFPARSASGSRSGKPPGGQGGYPAQPQTSARRAVSEERRAGAEREKEGVRADARDSIRESPARRTLPPRRLLPAPQNFPAPSF